MEREGTEPRREGGGFGVRVLPPPLLLLLGVKGNEFNCINSRFVKSIDLLPSPNKFGFDASWIRRAAA